MKGIVLAGGAGTRLHPITRSISKQIIPVYDKPMIFYPLSTLMLAGIREILIISTPQDIHLYENLLGNGNKIGLKLSYEIQASPDGLAQAFTIGEKFIGNDSVCLVLGDNIFYGRGFGSILQEAAKLEDGALVFGYYVNDPQRYGVADFDENWNVTNIEEKPENPKSNFAVTGLYFYTNDVIAKAKSLKPSKRGEYEITDLNNLFLSEGRLRIQLLGRGFAWLDTGTPKSLLQAANFIETLEERQGLKASCIEEIAYQRKFIKKEQLLKLAEEYGNSDYGNYLYKVAHLEKIPGWK
ncbi:MAG TPA: glucose-1-phosphate thymidylyltransferase RfbA [Bacteroidales bacterium]|nr:glucose-1-phosphate thymidylyltransferase RfbA [Bacteroidales bacterium]HXK81333.1 glucose-1-phosphate thymidylyltransferase RfbA [Bacteroidales bacterium]